MNRTQMKLGALGSICALALAAGCGGGSDSTAGGDSGGSGGGLYGGGAQTTQADTGAESTTPQDNGIVSTDDNSDLGEIITTSDGFTLYDFHKDKGAESSCYGACAEAWPPLLTKSGNPQAQGGADRSLLGTAKRKDGTVQVTYAGRPVYTYAGDTAPGDTNGNDVDQFGAEWYALSPAGQEPED